MSLFVHVLATREGGKVVERYRQCHASHTVSILQSSNRCADEAPSSASAEVATILSWLSHRIPKTVTLADANQPAIVDLPLISLYQKMPHKPLVCPNDNKESIRCRGIFHALTRERLMNAPYENLRLDHTVPDPLPQIGHRKNGSEHCDRQESSSNASGQQEALKMPRRQA